MPIRQYDAQVMCDKLLQEHKLYSKGWRTCFNKTDDGFLGKCFFNEKRIQLSILHLSSASEAQVEETIKHEIAHALIGPGKGHNQEWVEKAKEIGLLNPHPCSDAMNVDSARSLKTEEIKKEIKIKELTNACPKCGKTAIEVKRVGSDKFGYFITLACGHITRQEIIQSTAPYHNWTSETGKVIFPYQEKGIEFLEKANGRALIADEPGLGKTLQALGFLYFHQEETTPVLWVCKSTLKLQTMKETLDWCGLKWTPCIIENSRSYILPNFKIYIVSMDLLRNLPTEKIEKIGFKTVVADEIQHFKNPDSTRTAELRKLVSMSNFFIPLSGTPWKNRGQEYFPVLNMLNPSKFHSFESFKQNWVDFQWNGKKMVQGGIRNIPRFREYTKEMIIRRMRDDVLPDLPKINRQIRFVDMDELYKSSYDDAEEKVANMIKDAIIDDKNLQSIASEIMRLKHITGLAKVAVAIEDIKEFLEDTEEWQKITIFHHHIDVGNNLQNGDGVTYDGLDSWLVENGYAKSLRLLGGRGTVERDRIVQQFKNDPKCRVLIASTLASGEGLNLQFCQNAMMLERQWNPANEEQAELRFSRPLTEGDLPDYLKRLVGLKVSIRVPYFIADGTVDGMLTEIVERKRIAFRKTMNDKDANITWNENEIIKELASMIIKKRLERN